MDSNAVFAILLLIVGLAILTAEIFVPSGGLLGVITFITLIISIVFAYRAWGTSHPNIFGAFCIMQFLLVPTVIGFGFYMLPKTAIGKRVLLDAPAAHDLTPYNEEAGRLGRLVGRFGRTSTMLNPGGLVTVEGERLHAFAEALSIDPGVSVEIVQVRGSSIVVRPGTPPPDKTPDDSATKVDAVQTSEAGSLLDFEFPPSS